MCNVVGEVFTDALVQECEDIASALQQLEQGTIDLVLLDLSMPDADGIEGLSRLRAAAPATPVIVCSARDDPALVRDCFKLGIAGYLPKSSGMEVTRRAVGGPCRGGCACWGWPAGWRGGRWRRCPHTATAHGAGTSRARHVKQGDRP
jgi:DNA-binding NarL/FixJ family response regulator